MSNIIPKIPPLAGICSHERAALPGYSVEESVQLLRRYNWVERRLYELMAAFMNLTPPVYLQDYDWADEVLHAQIGRRLLGPGIGDASALMEKARPGMERPKLSIGKRSAGRPQVDWWPDFVLSALGKPSTAGPAASYSIISEYEKASG
ncbi:MAG TPA: hypothetical protein VHY37_00820 [Tepidisphaeraceae bacterium]|jgi:hypothetical protein|nr:hypothetical protein [Tepidisphaeraceae bacterium]